MFELKPTDENIKKVLQNNLLDRNKIVIQFLKIIFSIKNQCSLCIDGEWGSGKTFFVKECIESIKLLNMKYDEVEETLQKIKSELDTHFEGYDPVSQIYPIYFNAWEYDSNRDPLLTFIYNLIEETDLDLSIPKDEITIIDKLKKFISSFKIGGNITDSETGMTYGVEFQYSEQNKPNMLKDVISIKNVEENFRSLLKDILPERANKIVIFIDELDRCNPIFAVKLLEGFKHFFDDDRFVFVFSTNIMELKNTINNFYGNNFNGAYYLQKFFDLQFELPKPNMEYYISNQIGYKLTSTWTSQIIKETVHRLKFSLRDCNRYFNMFTFVTDYMDTAYWFENKVASEINKYILFPTLLAIKIKDMPRYNKIIMGHGKEDFVKFYLDSEISIKGIKKLITIIPEEELDIRQLLNNLYDIIFIKEELIGDTYIIDKIEIDKYNVEHLKTMLSFINDKIKL